MRGKGQLIVSDIILVPQHHREWGKGSERNIEHANIGVLPLLCFRILHVLCRDLKLEVGFNFKQLAKDTPGFVGADLMSLAREAAITAVSRYKLSIDQMTLLTFKI